MRRPQGPGPELPAAGRVPRAHQVAGPLQGPGREAGAPSRSAPGALGCAASPVQAPLGYLFRTCYGVEIVFGYLFQQVPGIPWLSVSLFLSQKCFSDL